MDGGVGGYWYTCANCGYTWRDYRTFERCEKCGSTDIYKYNSKGADY